MKLDFDIYDAHKQTSKSDDDVDGGGGSVSQVICRLCFFIIPKTKAKKDHHQPT